MADIVRFADYHRKDRALHMSFERFHTTQAAVTEAMAEQNAFRDLYGEAKGGGPPALELIPDVDVIREMCAEDRRGFDSGMPSDVAP